MKFRHVIIVPVSIRDFANQAAVALAIDPEGTLNTLSVPLVPVDGPDDAEPTHFAAAGQISEAARVHLEEHQDQFPGSMWWRTNVTGDDRGKLVASFDDENIGDAWGWVKSLEAAGLKRQSVLK